MVFDSSHDWPATPAFLSVYVDDVDTTIRLALEHRAELVTEVMTSGITGDRGGRLRDPVGNIWWVQTHQHDVSQEEMYAGFADPGELTTMRRAQDSFHQAMTSS